MKELLYYKDAMIQQFEADVTDIGFDGRHYIVLSNTAFYPTGGGQPHDTGVIGAYDIIDVEKIDGEIRHYIAGEDAPTLSGTVTAHLNWVRRFDHMQQHAGQHILTAAFVELFNLPTVSFHLGTDYVAIDLQTTAVTEAQLAAAEARANAIILENRPIETKWVTKEELAQYNLRKDLTVDEDIRLVIIPDYDDNGCGGTHPTSTGQVSAIKILEVEKMKQNMRVHFVCGTRVLQQLHMRKNVLSDVARQLSVPEQEAASALRKVLATAKANDKALIEAQNDLLQVEAAQLAKDTIVTQAFENRSIQTLQKLGRFITEQNEQAIVLLTAENEDKLQFIAARGKAVETSMKAISQAVLPVINGKGGGSDAQVQGGGERTMTAAELLAHMQAAL